MWRAVAACFITHGHADHWLGEIPLVERFPEATVYAIEATQRMMKSHWSPEFRASFWDKIFPDQLPTGELDVQVVGSAGFDLRAPGCSPSK